MNTSNLALHFPINLTVVAISNKNCGILGMFTILQKATISFDIPGWQTDRPTDMHDKTNSRFLQFCERAS
jgi:hypothetical protein